MAFGVLWFSGCAIVHVLYYFALWECDLLNLAMYSLQVVSSVVSIFSYLFDNVSEKKLISSGYEPNRIRVIHEKRSFVLKRVANRGGVAKWTVFVLNRVRVWKPYRHTPLTRPLSAPSPRVTLILNSLSVRELDFRCRDHQENLFYDYIVPHRIFRKFTLR